MIILILGDCGVSSNAMTTSDGYDTFISPSLWWCKLISKVIIQHDDTSWQYYDNYDNYDNSVWRRVHSENNKARKGTRYFGVLCCNNHDNHDNYDDYV